MKWAQHKKKSIGGVVFAMFIATGTYNAIVINSASLISSTDIRFVKRLDEVYGVTKSGDRGAASVQWQKIDTSNIAQARVIPTFTVPGISPAVENTQEMSNSDVPAAAVQEVLSLSLNEVINNKKWPNGLPNSEFNGSLSTNNGIIESLTVALPNGEGISVSFSEMAGNVFEYELENEVYSGMLYQVDGASYMVTLSNGPLEGTRLRFVGEPSEEQKDLMEQQVNEMAVAQTGNIDASENNLTDAQAQQTPVQPEPGSTAAIDYGNGADAPLYEPQNENQEQGQGLDQNQDPNANPEISANPELLNQDLQANSFNMENHLTM